MFRQDLVGRVFFYCCFNWGGRRRGRHSDVPRSDAGRGKEGGGNTSERRGAERVTAALLF